jgi:Zn-dependent protease with chaperone function
MSDNAAQWSTEPIDLNQVKDPEEATARMVLGLMAAPVVLYLLILVLSTLGLILFVFGFVVAMKYVMQLFALAYIKTNAIEVTAEQHPAYHAMNENFSARLGIEMPAIYIIRQGAFNAFATKLAGKRMVVLYSEAVDALIEGGEERDVAFLIGHELAHHALGHLDLPERFFALGNWFIWVGLWYSRCREVSCDRVALALIRDRALCTRAVVNMTIGTHLAKTTSVDAAIAQWNSHKDEFFVKYRTLYSTHPHNLSRIDIAQNGLQNMGW